MKVQPDSEHPGFAPDVSAIPTCGVKAAVRIMRISVEVIAYTEPQADEPETWHVTASLFCNELVAYVALFVPTLTPLTCH